MKNYRDFAFGLFGTLAIGAGAAFAAGDTASAIKNLPDEGPVSLSGIVDSVEDQDTFVLRDDAGETIDIHTKTSFNVKEGDRVQVQGTMQDEALGVGDEISATSVKVLSANTSAGNTGASGAASGTTTDTYDEE